MLVSAAMKCLKKVAPAGNMIAVQDLAESNKLEFLSLTTKEKRFWPWQKPKYQHLQATLGDILTEDHFPSPVVVESDFGKYAGKFEDRMTGIHQMFLEIFGLDLGYKGLVESEFSFRTLKMQELDLKQLTRDSAERRINLKNPVVQHVLENKKVLCVLAGKIVMTQQCTLLENTYLGIKCDGALGLQTGTMEGTTTENGAIYRKSEEAQEIPAFTSIAYSVIELHVKADGQFEFCTLPGKHGGFEDEIRKSYAHQGVVNWRKSFFSNLKDGFLANTSRLLPELLMALLDLSTGRNWWYFRVQRGDNVSLALSDSPGSAWKEDVLLMEKAFHPFVELLEPQKKALNKILHAVLTDNELLTAVEGVLGEMASNFLPPPPAVIEKLKPPQQQHLKTLLQLVGCSLKEGRPEQEEALRQQKLFSAVHLLVSALAEIPVGAISLLDTCWKLQIVPTLCHVLRTMTDDGLSDLEDPTLAPLKDAENFKIVQRLFGLAHITLEKLPSSVHIVMPKERRDSPLSLCRTLSGLCALGSPQK
ncbi:PREDICTED: non-syndromic hearing impairment protein 5 [Elephantulus edwardii]|uniref:non-syndromic hearing impairment protein 5 n=1 Tax=Elephantulus edwardii TaxID=28737 RepID=UPI0003F0DF5E|nr:PREDICTED: non-syndromic hearing impairment protein 5 [Elephantulus edwardii]